MNWCKCLPCINPEVEDVTTLDFSCSSLKEVPLLVFNFERTLQHLYLDCNKIVELPRTLFQCEEIRYLVLCDNEVETIPPLIEKLTNLEVLMLNRNCLAYESIPANIHRCHRLKVLHLSSNNLTKVPNSVTRLVCLKELYLNSCDIEYLPANFGRLNNLHILELRENHLSSLPKSLKQLSDLRRLDISSNMFRNFPDVIGTMTSITELWMNDNFISEVPDYLGSLVKLLHFDISCNRLEKLSTTIGFCSNMTLLLLSMNDLKELPDAIGNLIALHTLKVDHNLLESLPDNIGCLQNLEELDVQFNNLKSFPSSIGMLRKLNSLVSAQNYISYLPVEIGSCTSLSVLSLHYNYIIYLPEEIGHLQNLTSISLINNKLRYLPITILGLRKLKALWLSHNQIQPLISLQTETLQNGQVILTCVFLPQVEVPLEVRPTNSVASTGRRIEFIESNCTNDLPAKFSRIPTPHPKAFVKYQRTLGNMLRRNQDIVSHNTGSDTVHIKEANIIPMKNANIESNDNDILTQSSQCSIDQNIPDTSFQLQNIENHRETSDTFSSKDVSVDSELTTVHTGRIVPSDSISNNIPSSLILGGTEDKISLQLNLSDSSKQFHNGIKAKQPPPYHIAAAYSKGAHIFLNSEKTPKEAEPKHFTQDQPVNILNPQPKHARCIPQLQHTTRCVDHVSIGNNTIDAVLTTVSHLLRISSDLYDYKSLVEKYLRIINDCHEELDQCNLLDLKIYVLRTAEYLLSNCDYLYFYKSHILNTIELLHVDLKPFKRDSLDEKLKYLTEDTPEMERKIIFVEIIALLLEVDYSTPEYQPIIDELLVEDAYYQSFLKDIFDVKLDKEDSTLFKFYLIKVVLYFLSCDTEENRCKYIFNKILKIREKFNELPSFGQELEENQDAMHRENAEKNYSSKLHMNWVFGAHRNRKIVKVELTPCCYVLGFSVNQTVEGVFIGDVDINGNAFQKLFKGDKILMLDDRDISKIDPQEALKAVQVWGPETETFLVSRN
ncbi:hypothetical protein FQA39_LY00207 [Lamprigera yunnana]|nr:hypothetical protein FQA39_LY00207 [Lamprigera yunnana]